MKLDHMYRQYPAMFKWFERSFSAEPELGASYIYHCLGNGSEDNAFWTILEVLHGEDFRVSEDLLINASHAIIEVTNKYKGDKP